MIAAVEVRRLAVDAIEAEREDEGDGDGQAFLLDDLRDDGPLRDSGLRVRAIARAIRAGVQQRVCP